MDYLFLGNINTVFNYQEFYDVLNGYLIIMDKVGKLQFFLRKSGFTSVELDILEKRYKDLGYGPFRIKKEEYDNNKGNFFIEAKCGDIFNPNNRASIIRGFFCIDGYIFMGTFDETQALFAGLRDKLDVTMMKMPDNKFYFKEPLETGYDEDYDFKLDELEFEVLTDMGEELRFLENPTEELNILKNSEKQLDDLEFEEVREDLKNNKKDSLHCDEILVNSF